jgi:hypothetical protein
MFVGRPQREREEKQHQIVGMGNLANFIKFKSGDGEKLKASHLYFIYLSKIFFKKISVAIFLLLSIQI